ncbi:MAG TPA: DUF5683 domain-containing protein [Bacteroidales bacterium]|nr:DUF5683 domain-containing protein [Bacteroidales bacterium]
MTKLKFIHSLINLLQQKSIIAISCFFIFININIAFPQNTATNTDTIKTKIHSPKKAAWMSAVLPGLGQAYNKKYWKIPIIWAGTGAISFSVAYNRNKYVTYRNAYKLRIDNDTTTIDKFPFFSTNYLQTLKNYYRRNLELSIICAAALYTLNIIDATVDAYLYDFNINDDISVALTPTTMFYNNSTLLSLNIIFYIDKK